jgi:cell filamentation protein
MASCLAVYPWAGQDRTQTAPKLTIKKGPVIFANAPEIRAAVEFALHKGQDKDYMKARPGEIMGYLAYGHPFLDGNGRTIMTVHSVLAQRAGFSIDWAATKKDAYLDALTKEIESPQKGHLDAYLKPFRRDPIAYEQLAPAIARAPGLDGRAALDRRSVSGSSRHRARPRHDCRKGAGAICRRGRAQYRHHGFGRPRTRRCRRKN